MSLEKATDVALFTRAWIEIIKGRFAPSLYFVALFTRAWIEITAEKNKLDKTGVALFTRAWIEIHLFNDITSIFFGRPLHEGVD